MILIHLLRDLCLSYELEGKSEPFYTGGDVQFSSDGQYVLTTCGSGVKILCVATGRVEKTVEEVSDRVTGDHVIVM